MSVLRVEPEEPPNKSICECCGKATVKVHGYIFSDNEAHGVYFAQWSEGHSEHGMKTAISLGLWDEGSEASKRRCACMESRPIESVWSTRILNPEDSPWTGKDFKKLMGRMLSREQALSGINKAQFFHALEHIQREDARVKEFIDFSLGKLPDGKAVKT